MTPTARIAAEKRHAASLGVAGTLTIDGTNHAARIYTERGVRLQMDGGSLQQRRLSAIVLASVLPASRVIDASTGETRTLQVTHVETGLVYRLDPGGVDLSPYGVFWTLECSQQTAR